ncbi:hypothetical protein FB451DRAFT_1182673 [Mycena latifolia]|nr:hypothetical protein FB451DRAFT_1182673 [Mycena latifolia]
MGWQAMKRAGLKLKKAEDKVQEAVIGIGSGVYKNTRDAAEALQIPQKQATIHRRLTSTAQPRIKSQIRHQYLTPEQERVLAEWVKFYGFAGLPLSRKTIAAKTHRLQPCDVGAFGPSKTHWRARCDAVLHMTGETIPVSDIVKEWFGVRENSFKAETIKQAWFKSGINLDESGLFPWLTPEIFTAADFAPSISTSTQLHLPIGFPTDSSVESLISSPSPSRSSSPSPSPSTSTSDSPLIDVEQPPADLEGPALVEYYKVLALKLVAERDAAKAQAVAASAHAVLAGSHIQTLQMQLNAKGKKRAGNERTLPTTARMLTSAEGRALADEKRAAQQEKKAKEDENRSQRLLADAEIIKRRAELGRHGMEFSGKIKTLKAPQLKDLAWSLELDEIGTREVLIVRILDHFDEAQNEHLKRDKRYADLWREGRRRRAVGVSVSDSSVEDTEQYAPMDDVLTSMENIASGSGSPCPSYAYPSPSLPPPPTPPDAVYRFHDSWMPPQPDVTYDHPIDHPPPFTPQFYAYSPPSGMEYNRPQFNS